MNIFISYAEEGLIYAQNADNLLKLHNYKTYLSRTDKYGEPEWSNIGKGMYYADLVIFVVTNSSQDSYSQDIEFNTVLNMKKKIISFVMKGVELIKFSPLMGSNILFFTESDFNTLLNKFLQDLNNGLYPEPFQPALSSTEGSEVRST